MISADPGPSLAIGATILIETKRFPVFIDPAHSSVSNWGLFEGTALAVMFPKEGKANLLGSAILVAPGIAIGAMHVFTGVEEEVLAAKAGAYCFGVDGERIDMWSIRHVSSSSDRHSDLAIYSLEFASKMPDDSRFTHAVLSTRTPAIGETLTMVGFRELDLSTGPPPLGQTVVDVSMLASTGVVTQQFPLRRDAFGLPAPCIEVDCHTAGGMSGGPVFDRQGNLVGILSRGMDEGPSWVSLLWPALNWKFKGGWPKGLIPENSRLASLDPNLCSIQGLDAVTLRDDGLKVDYRPWS